VVTWEMMIAAMTENAPELMLTAGMATIATPTSVMLTVEHVDSFT
jgi:hypothetical protein